MPAIIAFIASLFVKSTATGVLKFIAYKALLLFLAVYVLPAVLIKVFYTLKSWGLDFVSSMLMGYMPAGFAAGSGMVELTGIAGYLGSCLNLAEGVTILVSCAFISWIVRLIRG